MEIFEDEFEASEREATPAEVEVPTEPRLARRLEQSKTRRAKRLLAAARSGQIVSFPANEGWGPAWAA
jgi:hypothetical protein